MFSKEELDCFRNHLHEINDSNSFPEEGEFQLFLDKSLSTLENENPSYRPAGSDCKPGGLLDFSSEKIPSIIVPDTIDDLPVTTILSKAFYSSYVKGAYIPESVVAIGEDIMWNANGDDAVIFGESGSYAETYSQNNSYNFFASDGLNGSFGDDIHWSFDIPTFSLSVWGSGAMPVYSGYDIYKRRSVKY